MDAIVICGGKGTRVRSITNDEIPKIMIPVNGKPFLEHLVTHLYNLGARNIVFAAGFKGEVIESYLGKRGIYSDVYPWPRLSVVQEDQPLDTAGGILNVLDKHHIHSNPFLIINGDCIVLPNREDCYEELYYERLGKPECAMFTCRMNHDGRYGSLSHWSRYAKPGDNSAEAMQSGVISGFKNNTAGESWINCGWYIVRHSFFEKYKNEICNRDKIQTYEVQKLSMEKDVFPEYLEDGQVIEPIVIDKEQFLEIGTPEALAHAERRLKEF